MASFSGRLKDDAESLMGLLQNQHLRLATAESCTGGLIAALLTEIPGSSQILERGFVTYSNTAKIEMIGVDAAIIAAHGAVSREVALAMASGAIAHSLADVSVAVTGIAGPGGIRAAKPAGLVHIAVGQKGRSPFHRECRFGDIGRSKIRLRAVAEALSAVRHMLHT